MSDPTLEPSPSAESQPSINNPICRRYAHARPYQKRAPTHEPLRFSVALEMEVLGPNVRANAVHWKSAQNQPPQALPSSATPANEPLIFD